MTKAKVFRADLYGLREGKYKALWETDVSTTEWEEVRPQTPFYLFAKRDENTAAEYEKGWRITEVMPTNVLGFQTHRDNFAIDFSEDVVHKRISALRDNRFSDDELKRNYGLKDNRDWKVAEARQELRKDDNWQDAIVECLYRPFDWRSCYFSSVAMDYPRRELIDNVFGKVNLCLLSSRQQGTLGYRHAWVAKQPANDCAVSTRSREANQVFPLYLYPNGSSLFDTGARRPNLSPEFIAEFAVKVGLEFVDDGKGDLTRTFGPEDVFNYIYAVFNAPSYRERYAEFLKIDFPRVPLTSNLELFRTLAANGETLVALHLMEQVGSPISSYPVDGDNIVDKVSFTEEDGKTGRVYINKTQYFDGVPLEVWGFYVGGYQVCQKWLKDRKGRTLSYDDLRHYGFIVSALFETIGTMSEVNGT